MAIVLCGALAAVGVVLLISKPGPGSQGDPYADGNAQEIARLEAENAQLREALAEARAEHQAPGLESAPGAHPPSSVPATPTPTSKRPLTLPQPVEFGPGPRSRVPLQPQITIPKGLEGTPEMWIVAIRKGLETGRHDLARHAQHALHALGAKGADALARAFAREEEPEAFRMSIFGALLNADRERGLEVAREWLSRERGPSTLRTSVLLQYARSGPDELPAGLTRLLDDPETPKADRTSVLLALMSADPAAASERLRALMFSRDATEQAQARDLLRNARDPAFRDLVLEAARTDDARKRNQYVNALAAMKGAGWGRVQMTGEPDTFGGGDQRTAWASKKGEEGNVTVELDFPTTLRPERVRVHETFNPGAIIRVEGRAAGSEWIVLWEGGPKATQAPRWFEPTLAEVETAVATIRLTLDTNAVKGWNEIDAVQLVGDGQAHYATEARCSSCYAGDTGF